MNENSNKIFPTVIGSILFGILIVLIGIFYQISKINDANRVTQTYKIYNDLIQWEKEHPDAKKWIWGIDSSSLARNYDRWEFDDYLSFYEALYSLEQKNLTDRKFTYDMFSGELEGIYEANNFELKKMIDSMRVSDNDPEDYIGVEHLYNEWEKDRKTMTGEHNPANNKK